MPPRSSPNPSDKEDVLTKNNKAYPKVLAYLTDHGLPPTSLKKIELKSVKDKLKLEVDTSTQGSQSVQSNATASASTFTKQDLQDYHWNFRVTEDEISTSSRTLSVEKMIVTVPTTHSLTEVAENLDNYIKAFQNPTGSLLRVPPRWMTAPLTADGISDVLQAMLDAVVKHLPDDLIEEELSLDQTPYPEGHTSTFKWSAKDPRSAQETFKRVLTVGPLTGITDQSLPQALPLQVGASRPRPDISTIFIIEGLQDLYNPIISAAEAKIKVGVEVNVQLAAALHPGLMLLSLFHEKYVDQAKEAEKTGEVKSPIINLPDWFFLVGLTYDQDGVVFYIHTPRCYEVAGKQKWEFASCLLDDSCEKAFTEGDFNKKGRMILWDKLLMMMRHTTYVRDQLQKFLDVARGDAKSYSAAFPDVFLELPLVFALEKENTNQKKTNVEVKMTGKEKGKEAKAKKLEGDRAKKEVEKAKKEEQSDLRQGGSQGTNQVEEGMPRRSSRKKH